MKICIAFDAQADMENWRIWDLVQNQIVAENWVMSFVDFLHVLFMKKVQTFKSKHLSDNLCFTLVQKSSFYPKKYDMECINYN